MFLSQSPWFFSFLAVTWFESACLGKATMQSDLLRAVNLEVKREVLGPGEPQSVGKGWVAGLGSLLEAQPRPPEAI
jgi:hypothetical protein